MSNLVRIEKKKPFGKGDLAAIGDKITSSLIRKVPTIDEDELRKIVKGGTTQSFLDMVAKGLSAGYPEKEYTILPKNKRFKRILIANRGEIALRVIRACREFDIETVVVYSQHDKDTLAVKFADKSFNLGAESSYLDVKRIINIAKRTKSDGIHPGYGFLAENAEFAKLCEKNKIKFIGPSSRTIELLSDKVKAKKISSKADVTVVEGYEKPLENKKHALKIAHKLGYPVMIKAAAGGGGKGMRIVRADEKLDNAYDAAETEAKLAFKDKTLYMEKYVDEPRHIEFQILADRHGNIIHLGERDCSIQRKHQKLVEEAPSPVMTEETRRKIGDAAIRIARAAKYEGAGTVEFLLDKNGNFYFIEVNTRIQVEHGVTEMITGVDLVKEQIKIAAGAELAYSQDDIKLDGCAIECRINAEDPLDKFSPSTGRITDYLPPGGPGIRVNSICHAGYKVLPHYDSLLSLLICHGSTRSEAISRMKRALQEYIIAGVKTTIPFHLAVLHNRNFIKGEVTTAFIRQNKIIDDVKAFTITKSKELTEEEKRIIVSTAVSKYIEKKHASNRPSSWATAGRQELMEKEQ